VADYYELHQMKKAVLILQKPDLTRQSIYKEEEPYIIIKDVPESKRFERSDKRSFEEIQRD
jgi:hypothetical protein